MTERKPPDPGLRIPAYNSARLSDRAIDELVGACRGVLADGAVTGGEAQFLLGWLETNRHCAATWPASVLYPRLREMLVDGTLDAEEEEELLVTLHEIVGGPVPFLQGAVSRSSALPLCNPAPGVIFPGVRFCLTGKFVFGTRKRCEAEVVQRGGIPESAPTRSTGFLVIGAIGSPEWIHSTHGRKIEAAVEMRAQGMRIHIVSEEHWTNHLA